MEFTIGCSCSIQQAFKSQLIRLIYDRTALENEDFLQEMDKFINLWCPTVKDCKCQEEED
jgi:hypothetical protein